MSIELKNTGLNEKACGMIINSIRESTQKQYTVYINRFFDYCRRMCINLSAVNEVSIVNFLQSLYDCGSGYSTINTACSAVCYVMNLLGFPIKSNEMLTKYKKGVFNCRPSLPKYLSTWDPQIVLDYFSNNDSNDILFLASKSVTLLALTSCLRVATLQLLKYSNVTFDDKKLIIKISDLQKQSRPGFHQGSVELSRYSNKRHCVVSALELYLNAVESIRKSSHATNLYLTTSKPYRNASRDTLARWIKSVIHKSGVPSCFTAHSTRSASTSSLVKNGVDIHTILKKAGWSSANTFRKFYYKPL